MPIQHVRLINGEEIVGVVVNISSKHVTVQNPLMIEEKKDEAGSVLILTKYIPFSKEQTCNLQMNHIITLTNLHPELERYYNNSLRLNVRTEDRIVQEIRRVNILMEEVMEEQEVSSIDSRMIHKTTDSKH